MSARIYLEGGGDSNDGRRRCRQGFSRLLEKCGYKKERMPRLTACGGRKSAYDAFVNNYLLAPEGDYIALLVDSEDPFLEIEATWQHLRDRDGWQRPTGADDEQVLLMTTCMETWLVAGRDTLEAHYGQHLQSSALPPLSNLESRDRHDVQNRLERATRNCSAPYAKGPKSFEVLGKISPDAIQQHLPSFQRVRRILNARL